MGRRRKGSPAQGFIALFVIFVVASVLSGALDFRSACGSGSRPPMEGTEA